MPTAAEVRAYCERFHLTYMEAPAPPLDDVEEWPDTVYAGFDDDPSFGACIISLSVHGVCSVVTAYADGIKRLQDRIEIFDPAELRYAISTGAAIHPTDEEEG